MSLKYNVSIHELMDFFCEDVHKGFSEESICEAEKNIGASLPDVYREFLLMYGADKINTYCHHIEPPEEICTSYQAIMEINEEDEEEYQEAVKSGNQEDYEDYDYFKLWQLPIEKWESITQNYVLIWHENQGVWYAGYLLSDLQNNVKNPPVYISTNDDFITFTKYTQDTQGFLIEMLSHTGGYFGRESCQFFTTKKEIKNFCLANGINLTLLQKDCGGYYAGNCLDEKKEMLCFYNANGSCENEGLLVTYKNQQKISSKNEEDKIIFNEKDKIVLLEKEKPLVLSKYSKFPYKVEMSPSQKQCGFDQPPEKDGVAIHFLVARALEQHYHGRLLVQYDWLRAISRIKRLTLGLNDSDIEKIEGSVVYVKTPVNLPPNFYWKPYDWSIIGKMSNLQVLSIEQFYVEDFSFLKECKNIHTLNLSQTNFFDCRLLLEMPNLKEVWLYNCPLEHMEILEKLKLKCYY